MYHALMFRPCSAGLPIVTWLLSGVSLAAFVLAAACAPSREQSASTADLSAWSPAGSASLRAPTPSGSSAPSRWELADRLSELRHAGGRARSEHLGGDHEALVLVNDAASAYPLLGPRRSLGAGAVLVEALYRPGLPDVEVYFVMARRPDDAEGRWEYLIVAPTGQVAQRGHLVLCDRCHAEAPHDRVFGRPR